MTAWLSNLFLYVFEKFLHSQFINKWNFIFRVTISVSCDKTLSLIISSVKWIRLTQLESGPNRRISFETQESHRDTLILSFKVNVSQNNL